MSYWRLYYHLVWATYERAPIIDPDRESVIRDVVAAKARELRVLIHATGGIDDHVHAVVSIPPTMAVAECVKRFKGASSREVDRIVPRATPFKWQDGYGAMSLGERSLPTVVEYVRNQREHHASRRLLPIFEQTGNDQPAPAYHDGRPGTEQ